MEYIRELWQIYFNLEEMKVHCCGLDTLYKRVDPDVISTLPTVTKTVSTKLQDSMNQAIKPLMEEIMNEIRNQTNQAGLSPDPPL